MKKNSETKDQLLAENEDLRRRLGEAEETLRAIHGGEVDALVLSKPEGEVVFTLEGAEHPYRVFVEAMSEGAATLDPDGTILYCNNRFAEMLETRAEQVIGSSIYRFIPPTDRSGFESAFQEGKQRDTTADISFKREDQGLIPAHVSFNILHGQEMPVVCMIAMDLTERKRLEDALRQLNDDLEKRVQDRTAELSKTNEILRAEIVERQRAEEALRESEEKYRRLVKYAPAAIYEMDLEGTKFLSVNEAMCGILGYSMEELLSTKPTELLDEESRPLFKERIRKKLAGETIEETTEYRIRRKDGEWIDANINVGGFSYTDEQATEVVVVGYDITARKKMEQALRQSNSSLAGINEILHTALTCETEAELGRACLDIAEKTTQSKFGFIGEINKNGLEDIAISDPGWKACNVLDPSGHRVQHRNFKIHGIFGRVLLDGKSLFTNDPAHHPDSIGLPKGHPPLRSFLGAPLIREGRTIGIVAVGNREGGYTQMQQDTLEALVPATVEAFMRKRAEEEVLRSRNELELRVLERTRELKSINEDLKAENEERLKVEIELRESESRLREISSELLNAQEKERRLVAREIHDSLGSSLAAAKFKVESAIKEVGENQPHTRATLGSILPMLQETIQETRRIQTNLRPPMLDDLGILPTISWFCRQYESTYSGIRIRQEIHIKEEEVADSLKTVIFRVLQEALNNSAKHSKASEVLLRVSKIEQVIELVIGDNGQGFDPLEAISRRGATRGQGLVGMQERVELSGGSFAVESSTGRGTVIRASWPV
jgi:PAS domain S-box-containing protein